MKLIDFITAQGRSISSFAKEWGVSKSTLTRVVNGDRWPTAPIMVRAHESSNGLVDLAGWIETCRSQLVAAGTITEQEGTTNGRGETSRDAEAEALNHKAG